MAPDETKLSEETRRQVMREMAARGGKKKTEGTKRKGFASLTPAARKRNAKAAGKASGEARRAKKSEG